MRYCGNTSRPAKHLRFNPDTEDDELMQRRRRKLLLRLDRLESPGSLAPTCERERETEREREKLHAAFITITD